MFKKLRSMYQFKVSIIDSKPLIWRQIQVPEDYTFGALHLVIQTVMSWYDDHLHEFKIKDPNTKDIITIGMPDPDYDDPLQSVWETSIKDYFTLKNKKALYTYDFGDMWDLSIVLEKICAPDINADCPKCLGGERAGPPEDCGGIHRYNYIIDVLENFKTAKKDAKESLKDFLDWLDDEDFHPEKFCSAEIEF